MLDCDLIRPDLAGYVDGELPATRTSEIETHLRSCAPCRTIVDQYRSIGKAATNMTTDAPSLWLKIENRIDQTDLRHEVRLMREEIQSLRAEVAGLRRMLASRARPETTRVSPFSTPDRPERSLERYRLV